MCRVDFLWSCPSQLIHHTRPHVMLFHHLCLTSFTTRSMAGRISNICSQGVQLALLMGDPKYLPKLTTNLCMLYPRAVALPDVFSIASEVSYVALLGPVTSGHSTRRTSICCTASKHPTQVFVITTSIFHTGASFHGVLALRSSKVLSLHSTL